MCSCSYDDVSKNRWLGCIDGCIDATNETSDTTYINSGKICMSRDCENARRQSDSEEMEGERTVRTAVFASLFCFVLAVLLVASFQYCDIISLLQCQYYCSVAWYMYHVKIGFNVDAFVLLLAIISYLLMCGVI